MEEGGPENPGRPFRADQLLAMMASIWFFFSESL